MAARDFQLTLAATAKRLSDVYGGAAGADPTAANDIPYRQLLFTATGGDVFIGSDQDSGAATTSTTFGIQVDSTALSPTSIGPFETGPIKLSQLWAAGASATVHMLGIPF